MTTDLAGKLASDREIEINQLRDCVRESIRDTSRESALTREAASAQYGRLELRALITELIKADFPQVDPAITACLAVELADELTGLGPVQRYLDDPTVVEVMINGPSEVWIEQRGALVRTASAFDGAAALRHLIERTVGPLGLRVDDSFPIADARLPDGSRFHAVLPPVARSGPVVTIRKFPDRPLTIDDLVSSGSLSNDAADFIASAVAARANIVISGGTSSGKTSFLNVVSSLISPGERLITVEDAAELRVPLPHVVSLEARPPNVDGGGGVSVRDLVRAALRMRPDRIIVGEVRGGEALDMLQAMNTGHEGSLTTVHANSARDLMLRVETMVLMADVGLSPTSVRQQITAAVDLAVHLARRPNGDRVVHEIAEVSANSDWPPLRTLFGRRTGEDPAAPMSSVAAAEAVVERCIARGHSWQELKAVE